MSFELHNKDNRVRDPINMGEEHGFASYDEVNDILPSGTRTWVEIDGLFSAFERHNLPV